MISFEIEDYRMKKTCYSSGAVFDTIMDKFGKSTEDAIDAESWCELAYVGEVYQCDGLTITVCEE